jgi:hypothetical protein
MQFLFTLIRLKNFNFFFQYCRKVWLALYDSNHIQDTKDEQHVKDFMISKYEKKRYYMEPSAAMRNGNSNSHSPTPLPSDNFKTQRPAVSSSSLTSPVAVSIAPPIPQVRSATDFIGSSTAWNRQTDIFKNPPTYSFIA